jgi:hypothetical protein
VRTITWPSGLERPAGTAGATCRVRPLPNTIRPCEPEPPAFERAEYAVFPIHHVAACCALGALAWAGLIVASRTVLDALVQLV